MQPGMVIKRHSACNGIELVQNFLHSDQRVHCPGPRDFVELIFESIFDYLEN